ncbi:MAG: hypothetical protein AAF644_02050, partial [Pseudomonadota bacterium]
MEVWRRLANAKRNPTHHRAISFQPSAISRVVWLFGSAPTSAGGSRTYYFAEIFFFLRIDLLLTIMASITDIIHIMNKEEIRQLKLFLNRTKTQHERKDVRLFDLLRKSSLSAEEDKIVKQLYGKPDRNAYYRLRNRLLEDIGKSFTLQYFNHSEHNQSLYFLALSRVF